MNYTDVRSDIKSGDIIAVHGKTIFSKITQLVQFLGGMKSESKITHVAMAWWLEGSLYSVEMDGKHNVLRPLSQYINSQCIVDIYNSPVLLEDLKSNFSKATSDSIAYGYWDNIKIGFRLLSKYKVTSTDNTTLVCSTFITKWLQWSNWIVPKDFPNMPCPAELCKVLNLPKFNITN